MNVSFTLVQLIWANRLKQRCPAVRHVIFYLCHVLIFSSQSRNDCHTTQTVANLLIALLQKLRPPRVGAKLTALKLKKKASLTLDRA